MALRESKTSARVAMDTLVTIELVVDGGTPEGRAERLAAAFGWFAEVERTCSRFDPASELSRLCARPGEAIAVSELLFSAVALAVALAERTDGAFDPGVGRAMVVAGFDRCYRTGERFPAHGDGGAGWRDIELDRGARTITLRRPMTLDLGAVAKGLAIDLAAQALAGQPGVGGFVIDAGGDIYAAGVTAAGSDWTVGIHHPRAAGAIIEAVRLRDMAICTSGDYERTATAGHHILDPRTGECAGGVASVSVIAPRAMAADALATAAFVLGPARGLTLLEEEGVEGVAYTPALERRATPGFEAYRA